MKIPLRVTTAFLGLYAGLIAIQHGIFEIFQGNHAPDGLMFNAIGLPCQPETIWHACFPALTLIPNLLVTGIVAVLVGIGMVVWAAAFARYKRGGLILGVLSLLALLVGGGFVPVFIGLIAAVTASWIGTPIRMGSGGWIIISYLWPWPLVLMLLWLPGSWLLGHYFGAAMLTASGLLFLVFDIGLPLLAAISSLAQAKRYKEKQ